MGHTSSKSEGKQGAFSPNFSRKEVAKLKLEFEQISRKHDSITKDQFMDVIKNHVQFWQAGSMFLERLFDAFDVNGDRNIDCAEFINGMQILIRGTPQQKMELTFKMYDLNRDGRVTQKEIVKFLAQIYSTYYNEDHTAQVKEMAKRLFDDLDINGDGELSLEEYKLSALKEPMLMNFVEQFLGEKEWDANNNEQQLVCEDD
ncbi:hypothetical protein MIR68_006123 [Amoeboaphelidium protococcarum]|nr:hypothetical protein MIR68_006123 [Amoeboaphelidium protococcarum]